MNGYIAEMRKLVGHRTLIQCAASVICINEEGCVLLGKRTDNHLWGYSGGSAEIDEPAEDCARRELLEETGLTAEDLEFFMVNSGPHVHYVYPNGDEVSNFEIIYLCHHYHGTIRPQEDEISELRFFHPEEIRLDMISEPIRPVMAKLLETLRKRPELEMSVSITETELTLEVLETLIRMSEDWEAEQSCYGYRKNDRSDIEGNRIFLAKDGEETIGYLFGHTEKSQKSSSIMPDGTPCFEIEELYVVPAYRSKGIGRQLFAYAEQAVSSEAEYIMLSTATKDREAIRRFYDRMGMNFWSARLFKKLK